MNWPDNDAGVPECLSRVQKKSDMFDDPVN